jgi:hypothetical protein
MTGVSDREAFGGHPVIWFGDRRSRRNFLQWAALIGVGGTWAAGGRAHWASAQKSGDVDVLNYALSLEYLEADFYNRGGRVDSLSRRERRVVEAIGEHERAHVDAITQTIRDLGGSPVRKPRFKYPNGVFSERARYLRTALRFQALGVRAYHGQVTHIRSKAVLGAAASIAGVESRHAAVLADLVGRDPFPAPLERQASRRRVLEAVRPFVKR